MVQYTCNRCFKEFSKKCDYIRHTEMKKRPCSEKIKETIEITLDPIKTNIIAQNTLPNTHNFLKNTQIDINESDVNMCCGFCGLSFNRKDNLKRHIEKYCKVKKLDEEKKEGIFNKLIEKEEKLELILKNFELLQENNKNLQKQIKNLEKTIKDTEKKYNNKIKEQTQNYDEKIKQIINKNITNNVNNNSNNNSNNTINNTVNITIPSSKLVNFGKENLSKIDYKKLLLSLKDWKVTGYHIFIEMLRLIHFNPELPEFQNIYMTDRNREKFMCFHDNIWMLNDMGLLHVLDHIEKLKNTFEEEFEEESNNNKNSKDAINKLYKFMDKYFEGDEEGNKNDEFINLVNNQLKDYLYNNREMPKNNFIKIKDDLVKLNNKKTIETNILDNTSNNIIQKSK